MSAPSLTNRPGALPDAFLAYRGRGRQPRYPPPCTAARACHRRGTPKGLTRPRGCATSVARKGNCKELFRACGRLRRSSRSPSPTLPGGSLDDPRPPNHPDPRGRWMSSDPTRPCTGRPERTPVLAIAAALTPRASPLALTQDRRGVQPRCATTHRLERRSSVGRHPQRRTPAAVEGAARSLDAGRGVVAPRLLHRPVSAL